MTESLFSILPDTATGSLRGLGNKPAVVNEKIFQSKSKGCLPVPKKRALGDVGNTLQSKALVNQPSKLIAAKKPQVSSTLRSTLRSTSKECKGPTLDSQASFKVACSLEEGDTSWHTCSLCCAGEEDNYADIRPLSERLTSDDLKWFRKGMFSVADPEPVEPVSPRFDFFRDESEFIPQLELLPTSYYDIDVSPL